MLAVAQCFRILYFDDNDDVDPFVLGIFSLVASAIFCLGALKVVPQKKNCRQQVLLPNVSCTITGGGISSWGRKPGGGWDHLRPRLVLQQLVNLLITIGHAYLTRLHEGSPQKCPKKLPQCSQILWMPNNTLSFRWGNPLFYSARLLRTFPYLVLDMTLLVSFVVMIHIWQVWVLINWQQQWKIFQRCWTDSLGVTSYSQACGPMQGEGPHQKYVQ